LIFDVEVRVLPPVDDTIGSTIDYDKIVEALQRVVDRDHHSLLETMAKNICQELFRELRVQSILIRIAKPMAIKRPRSAGVIWSMQRPAPQVDQFRGFLSLVCLQAGTQPIRRSAGSPLASRAMAGEPG
jgi:7,8-dihydroneopterin aldolase/epimerase/oxygenase